MSPEPDKVEPVKTEPQATTVEARLAAAEQSLEEALSERNRLWAELNEQRADRRELEQLRSELYGIRASTMWKVAGRYQRLKRLLLIGLQRLRRH